MLGISSRCRRCDIYLSCEEEGTKVKIAHIWSKHPRTIDRRGSSENIRRRILTLPYTFTYKGYLFATQSRRSDCNHRCTLLLISTKHVLFKPQFCGWHSIVPSVNTNYGHLEFHTTQSQNMSGSPSLHWLAMMIIKLSASL